MCICMFILCACLCAFLCVYLLCICAFPHMFRGLGGRERERERERERDVGFHLCDSNKQ